MISYEVDTIQTALAEYDGVADVLLTENIYVHNPHARRKGTRKQLLCSDSKAGDDAMWSQETADNDCVTNHLNVLRSQYDIVIVGSVDEILARSTLLRLKHDAQIGELPASGAIGMPLGLLGRQFRTDWHHADRPYSFSLPSIWPGGAPNPRRSISPRGSWRAACDQLLFFACYDPKGALGH